MTLSPDAGDWPPAPLSPQAASRSDTVVAPASTAAIRLLIMTSDSFAAFDRAAVNLAISPVNRLTEALKDYVP
ncbi:hypothetical protein GCM10009804_19720 [Kribbella hippodromi]|uniref:Uncharacterized protein n=1 Tax=Kribbella hippodromi TaxID=434347 RepID=A0ABN2CRG6_9ACTN